MGNGNGVRAETYLDCSTDGPECFRPVGGSRDSYSRPDSEQGIFVSRMQLLQVDLHWNQPIMSSSAEIGREVLFGNELRDDMVPGAAGDVSDWPIGRVSTNNREP
jgi:hypothetical protein